MSRQPEQETLQGQGILILPDGSRPVDYVIVKQAVGRLAGFEHEDIVFAVLAAQAVELVLEDGRRAKIMLAGLEGDFEVTGPISPKE